MMIFEHYALLYSSDWQRALSFVKCEATQAFRCSIVFLSLYFNSTLSKLFHGDTFFHKTVILLSRIQIKSTNIALLLLNVH